MYLLWRFSRVGRRHPVSHERDRIWLWKRVEWCRQKEKPQIHGPSRAWIEPRGLVHSLQRNFKQSEALLKNEIFYMYISRYHAYLNKWPAMGLNSPTNNSKLYLGSPYQIRWGVSSCHTRPPPSCQPAPKHIDYYCLYCSVYNKDVVHSFHNQKLVDK